MASNPRGRSPDRPQIQKLVAAGDAAAAAQQLSDLWRAEQNSSAAAFVVAQYEALRGRLPLTPYRLAILRSFTVEPLVPLLRAAAFCAGLDLQVYVSEFNAYVQDLVEPSSQLYGFAPDTTILAVQTRDLVPQLWNEFAGLSSQQIQAALAEAGTSFDGWFRTLRQHSAAHLIVHNLEAPANPARGIVDAQSPEGQTAAIEQINQHIRRSASQFPGIFVLDYDGLVARHGRLAWHDERKWITVRLPFAAASLLPMTTEWTKFLFPLAGKVSKVLVVDLDNTLWGGIIGEDGIAGIGLGSDYPGAAFQDLQRALLDLHRRGILLAICSKNNLDDAMEVLEKHEGMILKPSHFSAVRINWHDKSQNLREIAGELNLGLDSLAFLDDNSVERQMVRHSLPEVLVLDPPGDPAAFAQAVRECPQFQRLTLSQEDSQRGEMYQSQKQRENLERSVLSREDFYRSLDQEVEISLPTPATISRIAQLTNKTNQFNLTTRRYTELQVAELERTAGCHCFSLRVRDRFGDNGLTGVAILRMADAVCHIDTLLLSCRVIGRTIETAFLSFLTDFARSRGAARMEGWFLPTKKNGPAREFYPTHGFAIARKEGNGTLWTLDLTTAHLTCPDWCRLVVVNGDKQIAG
jgi:FkbH-like protein